jgi:hypothetical protein
MLIVVDVLILLGRDVDVEDTSKVGRFVVFALPILGKALFKAPSQKRSTLSTLAT